MVERIKLSAVGELEQALRMIAQRVSRVDREVGELLDSEKANSRIVEFLLIGFDALLMKVGEVYEYAEKWLATADCDDTTDRECVKALIWKIDAFDGSMYSVDQLLHRMDPSQIPEPDKMHDDNVESTMSEAEAEVVVESDMNDVILRVRTDNQCILASLREYLNDSEEAQLTLFSEAKKRIQEFRKALKHWVKTLPIEATGSQNWPDFFSAITPDQAGTSLRCLDWLSDQMQNRGIDTGPELEEVLRTLRSHLRVALRLPLGANDVSTIELNKGTNH